MRRALLHLLVPLSLLAAGCTGGDSDGGDRDGDGVRDELETTPRSITIVRLDGAVSRMVTSDPRDADTDDDGVPDGAEYAYGLDPRDFDTDGDGLLDGSDRAASGATADEYRRRGIVEEPAGTFLGELSRCPQFGGLKPDQESSDRPVPDRLGDAEERLGWNVTLRGLTRHVVSDPCLSDTDRDGLPDDEERDAGTDPATPDSDGDGTRDGSDADPAANLVLELRDVKASSPNGSVTLRLAVGAASEALAPGRSGAQLDVDDQTATRGSLVAALFVTAQDSEGRSLALTPHGHGLVLYLDLLRGTAALADAEPAVQPRLAFRGEDGTLSFEWAALRR